MKKIEIIEKVDRYSEETEKLFDEILKIKMDLAISMLRLHSTTCHIL